jgi:FecR protein
MTAKKGPKSAADDLDWFTVSYRSIYLTVGALLLLVVGGYLYLRQEQAPAPPPPPPVSASLTTARFTSIDGSVKVKAVGTFEWVTADRNMVLKRADLVRTGPGAAAEITFFDGTVVHVRPDSLITIEQTTEDPTTKQRRVAWHISSGEVNFQTVRRSVGQGTTEVSTPTVRGTVGSDASASVRVAPSGDSDIRMFRGSSRLQTTSGQKVELTSNEALKVDAAGQAGPKLTLPGVPVLVRPPHQSELAAADPVRAITLLEWKPVPGAVAYHLMLDFSPSFNRPLIDRRGIQDTSQDVRGLDAGKYYWRVAALDKAGNEGAFSDFSRFTLTKSERMPAAAPPPLTIDSLDVRGNIVQIKGRSEPGATVSVNGQRLEVQADGSFNEFITLEGLGKQTLLVRAVGLNGGVTEQRRSITAAF